MGGVVGVDVLLHGGLVDDLRERVLQLPLHLRHLIWFELILFDLGGLIWFDVGGLIWFVPVRMDLGNDLLLLGGRVVLK